jgi:arginyl-tRNA synthetase
MNLYSYLRTTLQTAINNAFPDISISAENITIFHKAPDGSGDLSAAVALKIASIVHLSPRDTATCILQHFEYDHHFLDNDSRYKHVSETGFINFFLQKKYLHECVVNNSDLVINKDIKNALPDSATLKKSAMLLQHLSIRNTEQTFRSNVDLDLLREPEELNLMRIISVVDTNGLHSAEAAKFFIKLMTLTIGKFLHSIPVITNNEKLTKARTALLQAAQNKISLLLQLQ